jgi:CIC family chloride channel protein
LKPLSSAISIGTGGPFGAEGPIIMTGGPSIGRLPVVRREDPHKLVGYLGRAGVMAARLRRLEEEHVREQGLSFNAT